MHWLQAVVSGGVVGGYPRAVVQRSGPIVSTPSTLLRDRDVRTLHLPTSQAYCSQLVECAVAVAHFFCVPSPFYRCRCRWDTSTQHCSGQGHASPLSFLSRSLDAIREGMCEVRARTRREDARRAQACGPCVLYEVRRARVYSCVGASCSLSVFAVCVPPLLPILGSRCSRGSG